MGNGNCDDCAQTARLEERSRAMTREIETMWRKVEDLSQAIGTGKNWIIGLLVTLALNLVAVIGTAIILIARLPS